MSTSLFRKIKDEAMFAGREYYLDVYHGDLDGEVARNGFFDVLIPAESLL